MPHEPRGAHDGKYTGQYRGLAAVQLGGPRVVEGVLDGSSGDMPASTAMRVSMRRGLRRELRRVRRERLIRSRSGITEYWGFWANGEGDDFAEF